MRQTPVQARQAARLEACAPIAWPKPSSGVNGAGAVELAELSRFEGEGGRLAPNPDAVEVRLDDANSRWPCQTSISR